MRDARIATFVLRGEGGFTTELGEHATIHLEFWFA